MPPGPMARKQEVALSQSPAIVVPTLLTLGLTAPLGAPLRPNGAGSAGFAVKELTRDVSPSAPQAVTSA